MAKMGQFSPKSKAIGLIFCRILTKIHFPRFSLQSEKWLNGSEHKGYRLGIFPNFDEKLFSKILIVE